MEKLNKTFASIKQAHNKISESSKSIDISVKDWLSNKVEFHQLEAIRHRKNSNKIKEANSQGLVSGYQSTYIHLLK